MNAANASTGALIPHSFNDTQIIQRQSDGYFNATAMCKATGKLIADYKRQSSTTAFLKALATDMGIPTSGLLQSTKGGIQPQGTWCHPKVAVHLAQWLSPEFAVTVTGWVIDWVSTGKNPVAAEYTPPKTALPSKGEVQHFIITQVPGQAPETRELDADALLRIIKHFPQFCLVPSAQYQQMAEHLAKASSMSLDLLQFGQSKIN